MEEERERDGEMEEEMDKREEESLSNAREPLIQATMFMLIRGWWGKGGMEKGREIQERERDGEMETES